MRMTFYWLDCSDKNASYCGYNGMFKYKQPIGWYSAADQFVLVSVGVKYLTLQVKRFLQTKDAL